MCVCKFSPSKLLVQSLSLLLKALSSESPPQSLSSKLLPSKLLVQSALLKALKASSFSSNCFLSRLFFFKAFSFKAFCSKRFLHRILKDIKGSRNQTSCCETLTRRNLSATKSATYVHLVFPKTASLTKFWGRGFGAKRFQIMRQVLRTSESPT